MISFAIKKFITKEESSALFSWKNDVWLVISLVILALYFTLPDSIGYSGFVSVRFALLFFLFLIVWITVRGLPKWFGTLAVGLAMLLHVMLLSGTTQPSPITGSVN